MKRRSFLGLLLVTACSGGPRAPRGRELVPLAPAIRQLVSETAADGGFSGVVLVAERGQVTLSAGFGSADRASGRPNDDQTIFRIGSLTKQFTAAAILILAQQGKLSLADPLLKYLPYYPRERLTKDGREVALRHLLTHTSGIREPGRYIRATLWKPTTFDALICAASSEPLASVPGADFEYSNTGYMMLGRVVELVSHTTYSAFLEQHVFDPAGMGDSGVVLRGSLSERAAIGYHRPRGLFTGDLISFAASPKFQDPDLTGLTSAGSVYTTARDLLRWDRALAGNDILSAESKEKLFSPDRAHYALGWVVEERRGRRIEWHNGALSPLGFTSLMVRVPETDTVVIVLSNLDLAEIPSDFDADVLNLAVRAS